MCYAGGMNRDLEFLYEVGSLRYLQRGWRQHFGKDVSNILEHTMRVVFLALMIAEKEGQGDTKKIMQMALVHDLAETRCTDLSYVQKVYVDANEDMSADHLFQETSVSHFREVLAEYEKRESIEAKIVKDADNLEVDIEIKELAQQGSQLPKKWEDNRRMVRDEKLYTETAKKMWDEIQESDVDSWHLSANKWKKIPDAGK